jgi:hypothetical protein
MEEISKDGKYSGQGSKQAFYECQSEELPLGSTSSVLLIKYLDHH